MNKEQLMVREFHETFDITTADRPCRPSLKDVHLRYTLMTEELAELSTAMLRGSITDVADGIADLLYVVYGTALTYGLDMELLFAEVHRSNMTKKGGYKREDGKWIKPPTYSPPNLKPLISDQME